MTMNEITVGIYSYKGKKLFDTIETLLKNKSDNTKIIINVKDQHPMDRDESFKKLIKSFQNTGGSYHHVFWDWIVSPILHKEELLRIAKTKYYLFLSDNISLKKNWDIDLIDNIKNNTIISGKGKITLKYKNLFYISANENFTNEFNITNYINRDFIFGDINTIKIIKQPKYLKYDGEEETLSILYFDNNIKIISCPSNIYEYNTETSIGTLYTPFQVGHFYNHAVKLMRDGFNGFEQPIKNIKDFWSYHNFDISKLRYLPFEMDDVLYDPISSKYDKIDGKRFIDKQNAIN